MIKANKVQALAIQLTSGCEAILVQDGPEWNNLTKFRCIHPAGMDGKTIVAARNPDDSPLSAMFGALFQINEQEKFVVVMASPELAAQIKREEANA